MMGERYLQIIKRFDIKARQLDGIQFPNLESIDHTILELCFADFEFHHAPAKDNVHAQYDQPGVGGGALGRLVLLGGTKCRCPLERRETQRDGTLARLCPHQRLPQQELRWTLQAGKLLIGNIIFEY